MPITRVGINGFGPLGRQVFKLLWGHYPELQIGAIGVADTSKIKAQVRLLECDPAYGRFPRATEVRLDSGTNLLRIDGRNILIIPRLEPNCAGLWANHHIKIVIDTRQYGKRQYSLALLKLDADVPLLCHRSAPIVLEKGQATTPALLRTLHQVAINALMLLC